MLIEAVLAVPLPPLHKFPELLLEVSSTLPPAQKEAGPAGVIEGVAGIGFTVTPTIFDTREVHPNAMVCTVTFWVVLTVAVLAVPSDPLHKYPEPALEVSTVLPPVHKVMGPGGVMVGVAGIGFTVMTTGAEVREEHPAVTTYTV